MEPALTTTQPSQAAREGAARLLRYRGENEVYCASVERGEQDDGDAVRAFARFEHDTEKRVRESVATQTSFRAWLAFCIEQACYNRDALDPRAAEILANVLEQYDARESLAGEANVERVAQSNTHTYEPHHKYPWFCEHCGYPEHERLKHSTLERTTDAG